jgi:hypothetical protein
MNNIFFHPMSKNLQWRRQANILKPVIAVYWVSLIENSLGLIEYMETKYLKEVVGNRILRLKILTEFIVILDNLIS